MWSKLTAGQRAALARKLAGASQRAYEDELPALELEMDALIAGLFTV
jgi:hypothetical protein